MKETEIEKLRQLVSRTDMSGNQKVDWLVNFINEREQALRIHDVVGRREQLNCDHEWKVEAFDCYGMPYEQYCEVCGKKEAI